MLNELNLTPELLEKAKSATSATALLAFAQENGITLTTEEAANYYTQLHPKAGALSDDELDNVSGGCGGPQTTKDLAIEYAQTNYCGRHPSCSAYQSKDAIARVSYMAVLVNEGKLCYCCRCETLIDAHCVSMGWPQLELSTYIVNDRL